MSVPPAVVAVAMEALGCRAVPCNGNKYDLRCIAHWALRWTPAGCPAAVEAASKVAAVALREAAADADPWDELHAAASWLMARADEQEATP